MEKFKVHVKFLLVMQQVTLNDGGMTISGSALNPSFRSKIKSLFGIKVLEMQNSSEVKASHRDL